MTEGAEQARIAALKALLYDTRARSAASAALAARAAESAAVKRGRVERTVERLAEHNPQHMEQWRAIRSTAATQREAIGARRQLFYAGRGGVQLSQGQQDEPAAATVSALDVYLRDMAVIKERERIAAKLLDEVIRRVFAAGLTLQGAAGLTTAPQVRQRIEAAIADLDEVIQAIRNTVFQLPDP